VLDEVKRREVLAILSVGCSQTMAARYVGCSRSTIRREAERDPKFAEKLSQAICNAELGLVKNIRNAAKQEKYWRAAAWALERRFPERYARRGPDGITSDQLEQILTRLAERVTQLLPASEYRKQVVKDAEALARSFGRSALQRAGDSEEDEAPE
jgi:hypothetical protein